MAILLHTYLRNIIFFVISCLIFYSPTHASPRYVIIQSSSACRINFAKVDAGTFSVLMPKVSVESFLKSKFTILDSCECNLLAGDNKICAIAAVSKKAVELKLTSLQVDNLNGKIFIILNDYTAFKKIYQKYSQNLKQSEVLTPWEIVRNSFPQTSPSYEYSSKSNLSITPPPPPPPPPKNPPAPPANFNNTSGDPENNDKDCEVEKKICFDIQSKQTNAEFEMKCKGLPPIVLTTEVKGGVKIGPIEISLSAESNSDDKKN